MSYATVNIESAEDNEAVEITEHHDLQHSSALRDVNPESCCSKIYGIILYSFLSIAVFAIFIILINLGEYKTRIFYTEPLPDPKIGENLIWYGPFNFYDTGMITSFKPVVNISFVHHMVVYKSKSVWDSPPKFLKWDEKPDDTKHPNSVVYAWARTGQKTPIPFKFPYNKGIMVGPDTDVQSIYLNIHYELDKSTVNDKITAGLEYKFKKKDNEGSMAVQILAESEFKLPPGEKDITVRHKCEITKNVTLYAFRNHAHMAGRQFITNLYHNDEIHTIIHKSVQNPQIFYYLNKPVNLYKNDIIELQCHYDTSDRVNVTKVGASITHKDEMCNQYLMYYTHNNNELLCKRIK